MLINEIDRVCFFLRKVRSFFITSQLVIELVFTGIVVSVLALIEPPTNWENILLGLLSSLILVIIFGIIQSAKDYGKFGYLFGEFRRIRFFEQDFDSQSSDNAYKECMGYYRTLRKQIRFVYKGSGVFIGIAEYSGGTVHFEICLDENNPSMGKGSYHYVTDKKNTRALQNLDFGIYTLYKYTLNIDYVILYHENVVPSKRASGYELLQSTQSLSKSISKIKKAITKRRKLKLRLSNSHDYTNDQHYLIFHPYSLARELDSDDDVVYGYVEQSLFGFYGITTLSVPFISTLDLVKDRFDIPSGQKTSPDLPKFEMLFPM